MTVPYVAPSLNASAFNCPHCGAYARQYWSLLNPQNFANRSLVKDWKLGLCSHCDEYTWWKGGVMIEPRSSTAPMPVSDMPSDVRADYMEARSIAGQSPRGAAALLRLAIQKLAASLDQKKGSNLNENIANLVKAGLPPKVQESLDVVRVIGNEAVHPGVIDLNDKPETASALFKPVNIIVEKMITQPAEVDSLYASLPERQRAAIEKRDGKK